MYVSRQYRFGGGAVGDQVLAIAAAKTDLGFVQAIALGAFLATSRSAWQFG